MTEKSTILKGMKMYEKCIKNTSYSESILIDESVNNTENQQFLFFHEVCSKGSEERVVAKQKQDEKTEEHSKLNSMGENIKKNIDEEKLEEKIMKGENEAEEEKEISGTIIAGNGDKGKKLKAEIYKNGSKTENLEKIIAQIIDNERQKTDTKKKEKMAEPDHQEIEIDGEKEKSKENMEKVRVEGGSETPEKEAEEGGDETLPNVRRGKEKVNADEEEDEEEEEMEDLPRGYYKVEHIRDKKFIKGVAHYLIKWVGWPESANTWEPIQHLDMCIEAVHAYDESLGSRKNKERPMYDSQASSSKPSKKRATLGSGANGTLNGPKRVGAFKRARCFPKGKSSSIGAGPCNGIVKIDRIEFCPKHLRGANRRKCGPVKRFIPQVAAAPDQSVVQQNRTIGPVDGAGCLLGTGPSGVAAYDLNQPNSDDLTITRIIEIKNFSEDVSNGVQEVVVTFTVLRSDGSEVTANNKYLKAKYPVLLANFYEQHLRI